MRQIGSIDKFGKRDKNTGEVAFGFIASLSGDSLYFHKKDFSPRLKELLAKDYRLEEKVVTFEILKNLQKETNKSEAVKIKEVDEETDLEPLKSAFLSMKSNLWLPATFRLFDLISDKDVITLLGQKSEALPAMAYHAQKHLRVAKVLLSPQAQNLRQELSPQFALRLYAAADDLSTWEEAILYCRPPQVNSKVWEDFCHSVAAKVVCGTDLFFEMPPSLQARIIEQEANVEKLTACFLYEDRTVWEPAAKVLFNLLPAPEAVQMIGRKLANNPSDISLAGLLSEGVKKELLSRTNWHIRQRLLLLDLLDLYRHVTNPDDYLQEILACKSEVTQAVWDNFLIQIGDAVRFGSELFYTASINVQQALLRKETDIDVLTSCFLSLDNRLWEIAAARLFAELNDNEILLLVEKKIRTTPHLRGLVDKIPGSVQKLLLDKGHEGFRRLLNVDDRLSLYRHLERIDALALEILECRNSSAWGEFCKAVQERLSYADPIYLAAPDSVKTQVLNRQFAELFGLIQAVTQDYHGRVEWKPEEIYREINQSDRLLAKKWMGDVSNQPEEVRERIEAQMISARGAEKVAQKFYLSLGYDVADVSITQVNNASEEWKTYDLLVKGSFSDPPTYIDVKNARTPVSSRIDHKRRYVEYCVPKFKEYRDNQDVTIAGVLSPYMKLENFLHPSSQLHSLDPITFLGETTKEVIQALEAKFSKKSKLGEICIRQKGQTKDGKITWIIPAWAFEYRPLFYQKRNEIKEKLRVEVKSPIPTLAEFGSVGINPLPAFLASGIALPEHWQTEITRGQSYFYRLCLSFSQGNITLPVLFLAVLTHFVEIATYQERWDLFHPEQYNQLIFENNKKERPLGVVDPLGIISDFIATLATLWEHKGSFSLHEFDAFKFNGLGLLRGRRKGQSKFETILAYCGGTIEKQGKCGKSPLVIGNEKVCDVCGHLICSNPDCDFCSYIDYVKKIPCPGMVQRKKEREMKNYSGYDPEEDFPFELDFPPEDFEEDPEWITF